MGFDAGVSPFATAIAIAYLLTVIPAIIIGLLPLKVLRSPPLLLKTWYYWLAIIAISFVIFSIYSTINKLINYKEPEKSGELCVKTKISSNENIWVQLSTIGMEFSPFFDRPLNTGEYFCSWVKLKHQPTLRAYLSDTSKANSPVPVDVLLSKELSVPLKWNGKSCIEIYRSDSHESGLELRHTSCDN